MIGKKYTRDRILHYLLTKGEPDIVLNIAAGIGVSHSAARTALMRQQGYTFIEVGRVAGNSKKRHVLWAAWEW